MIVSRLVACVCVAIGLAAAIGAASLIWQAPHCRPVAARAHYTPLAAQQCGRGAHSFARRGEPR
jgi:hypothetical protein